MHWKRPKKKSSSRIGGMNVNIFHRCPLREDSLLINVLVTDIKTLRTVCRFVTDINCKP